MPRNETILEGALSVAKAAQALCDVPTVGFLKPAAAIAVQICELAKVLVLYSFRPCRRRQIAFVSTDREKQ
jgi:hypothetical protein